MILPGDVTVLPRGRREAENQSSISRLSSADSVFRHTVVCVSVCMCMCVCVCVCVFSV